MASVVFFPAVNSDFTGKLDEVAEYYERKGLCQGEECSQLRVQVSAAPLRWRFAFDFPRFPAAPPWGW